MEKPLSPRIKSLFIFDVDGTLVNAYPAILESLNFTRKRFSLAPVSLSKVIKTVGAGDRLFIKEHFPEDLVDRALKVYRLHHKEALLRRSACLPNARRTLYALRRRGKTLAVASNRPQRFTETLLKKTGLRKYFHAVYCADRVKALKPDPKMLVVIMDRFGFNQSRTVYIGDMAIDMEAAKAARVEAVFKRGGSSTLKEVSAYKPKVISELPELLTLYS